MGKKKCEPSNCNEVISRYELLQELHRRDQDSEDVVATINDMTPIGLVHDIISENSSKCNAHDPIDVSDYHPMTTPIVVAVDITPMSGTGVPMAPNSTRFLATLEPANCDRLGVTADYIIDVGEKRVVLHKDGSKITGVSIECVDR